MTNEAKTTTMTTTDDKNSYLSQNNFEHYYRISNMMASSDMVPKGYKGKPQDILLAMEMGRSLGLAPLSAVQNIAVINGKPSLYGDGMLAICSGHPEFENIKEEAILTAGQISGYKCSVQRKNRAEVTKTFTIADAKTANLWGKSGPWVSYPSRMLQMRARAFALRDSFADALGGIRCVEEVQDYEPISPKSTKGQEVKEDLKSFIDKNKGVVFESEEIIDDTPTVRMASLDQLTLIGDIITENKIDAAKVESTLQMFGATQAEHLTFTQVEDFVTQLLG